jgi:hypothetical protein
MDVRQLKNNTHEKNDEVALQRAKIMLGIQRAKKLSGLQREKKCLPFAQQAKKIACPLLKGKP